MMLTANSVVNQRRRALQSQGYMTPRRSLGGQHLTTAQRMEAHPYAGYSPATAGQFGGRPRGRVTANQPIQTSQADALTRYPVSARAYIQRPFGGVLATTRRSLTTARGW